VRFYASAFGAVELFRNALPDEVIPHLFGANQRPTGQRGFYMHFRVGTGVLVPDAFRLTNHSG
jgi:predicted phage gp36 major capsid-like protein